MMPFLYPIQPNGFPMLIVSNQNHIEEEGDDDDNDDDELEDDYLRLPMDIFPGMIPTVSYPITINGQISSPIPIHNNNQDIFRLSMNVDGFQPHELNISIQHDRLIVHGKHIIQAQPLTTNLNIDENDDTEPDFISKEFKRTFTIPSNVDVRKAYAQFYPQQQFLIIEIPVQSQTIRINRERIRPMDIFLSIITILLMDRAIRIAYEQFIINEHTSSQYRNIV